MKFSFVALLLTLCIFNVCKAEAELVKNWNWAKLNSRGVPANWESRVSGSNTFAVTSAADGNVLKITVKDPAKTAFMKSGDFS